MEVLQKEERIYDLEAQKLELEIAVLEKQLNVGQFFSIILRMRNS